MKKKVFWIGYAAFVVVLVVLSVLALNYVDGVLTKYEASQPEKAVEAQMERIKTAATNDTLEEVITFFELEQKEYDIDISDYKEYKDKIKNAKELTYKVKTGSYSETEQFYNILADDEIVAVLTLESINEEVKLAILTMNEWQLKSIVPVMTLMNYSYKIEIPESFSVAINGTTLTDSTATKDGWKEYSVEKLYTEPDIKVYDEFGEEALYNIVDNNVKAVAYSYNLRLPKEFSVSAGGRTLEGVTKGEEKVYEVTTIYEQLKVTDAYGNSIDYKNGDSIYTYDYQITIPDNFKIALNGKDVSSYKTETVANSKYKYCVEYADMPQITTYEFTKAVSEPAFEIYDNLNKKVDCIFDNYAFEITEQAGLEAVPEEIASKVDVLKIAQMWSRLMTNDLEGSDKGFGTIKNYLIKDSYLYDVAYSWVKSPDITFVSPHVLSNPPFSEEKVTNYISYGENFFSCDISFLKDMDLTLRDMHITDKMNSTFYFMYIDETDDGKDNAHWVILDIQEIVSE